jgi:hypothetical protein
VPGTNNVPVSASTGVSLPDGNDTVLKLHLLPSLLLSLVVLITTGWDPWEADSEMEFSI